MIKSANGISCFFVYIPDRPVEMHHNFNLRFTKMQEGGWLFLENCCSLAILPTNSEHLQFPVRK